MLPSEIRASFSSALSQMYRAEVPLYGDLVELVNEVNADVLEHKSKDLTFSDRQSSLQSLGQERHGAIRLGTASELNTMRRLFSVMAMFPVGYYDLSEAGLPVHSTAFRPIERAALEANPFRMFTSLLRIDLINNSELQAQIKKTLNRRNIFSASLIELIEIHEKQGGLTASQSDDFVRLAVKTFCWHKHALVSRNTYRSLHNTHRLLADIVSFKGPHINHLTPRTLDIDNAQHQMESLQSMQPKAIVEGPPKRKIPILLRQTSFQALRETVYFKEEDNSKSDTMGSHTARFGEIEQRGAALTRKGRALYDRLLNQTRTQVPDAHAHPDLYRKALEVNFRRFPDDLDELRLQELVYFEYRLNPDQNLNVINSANTDLENLVIMGIIVCRPITYEDFLPVSAAGIFHSNLGQDKQEHFSENSNQHAFENDLGCPVINEFDVYENNQQSSIEICMEKIKLRPLKSC